MKFDFTLEPKEAIEYLKSKGYTLSFNYYEVMKEAHHRAFTVAKVMNYDLLKDIHHSLIEAQKKGIGFKEWKKNITPTLKKYGWYGETEVLNPATGEIKKINVNSRRLETIYQTNMRMSYNVARYKQMRELPLSIYWRYVSKLLPTSRATHKKMHGIVLHRDHPFWKKNKPQNGYNCKCKVTAHTKEEVERRGWKITEAQLPDIADPGFDYDIEEGATNLDFWEDKIDSYPERIKERAREELNLFKRVDKALEKTPTKIKPLLYSLNKNIILKEGKTTKYNLKERELMISKEYSRDIDILHEYGHILDHSKNFLSTKASFSLILVLESQNLKENKEEIEKNLKEFDLEPLDDIFYMNSNREVGRVTREISYFEKKEIRAIETFANLFSLYLINKKAFDIIKNFLPNTIKIFKKIIKRLIDDF